MSVLDAFSGLLGGSGKSPLPVTLAVGEDEVTRAVASFRPGGLTSVGGDLVLTTKRLVFTPLNVTDVVKVLTWALGKAGAPDFVAGLPEKLGGLVEQEDFGGLTGVAVGGPPRLTTRRPSSSRESAVRSPRSVCSTAAVQPTSPGRTRWNAIAWWSPSAPR
ncbi:hypothetical protein GCM10011609_09190 [Lentzea pudingi]|uniref:Uncharacterized protein n=1 Tax=Lentzea pudingi TaxID=1789439 RepID=A0ABQ2HC65_9PSEU|nr:hypothetical protein [Lentzea pudingi]GGM75427.1 hypothetical protein GCM10011609_09190 [Lentzea pudingi]